jgi:predicted amidohydrolase YtcJ
VKDPGIAWDTWEAYQDVLAAGDLTVRVFVLWCCGPWVIDRVASFTRPYDSTGDDHLISGGAKLYLDGSGGARTAWLYDDWNKDFDDLDQGNRGYPVDDPEELRELIRTFHNAGLHVSVHAIGDRAIDWVVDSYASALRANPTSGLRHGIIHANIPTEHAIDLMAELQRTFDAAYPEPSATFMWWIGGTYAGNFGPDRSRRLNPFRTYIEKGIRWAQGSDYYVTPFPARYGLWASIERETLLGVYGPNPFGKDESIDIANALRSYTIWSARQMFLEDKIGSIEVGKYADLAVWDKNLYEVPSAEIKDLRCQMTVFNGQIVYRNPDAGLGAN